MKINAELPEDESDEDDVYPLSIKYNKIKVRKINWYRFTLLFIILLVLIPSNFYTNNAGKTLPVRTGYFADQIYEESFSISGLNEIAVKTQNCIVYLLENIKSKSQIDIFASVSRTSSVEFTLSNSVKTISVQADAGDVQWYVEVHVPGGVTIPKLNFVYSGDSSQNVLLYDYKGDSVWTNPMIISELYFSIKDSYPNIYFRNSHFVSLLSVLGTYWIWSFENLKIASMTFTVSVGSLNIVQNSMYTQNSVTVKTPHGTHCVAAAKINSVDTNWPKSSVKDAGFNGTFIDTSVYCQSALFVWSDLASSCPASGTAVSSGQGSFKITLDDGPVQFLINGSTTTASLTYTPTYDQYAITSQILLTSKKNDFSSYPSDPRIYLYPTVSPGYARMWIHSSLKQYIQARPWLLTILSLSVLQPTFYRYTLIHIPGSSWPYLSANNVKQNTLISKKLYNSVYTDSTHSVSQMVNNTYFEYEYTAKGDYIETEIAMLTSNTFILLSVLISGIISLLSIVALVFAILKCKSKLETQYFKYLSMNRNLSRTKKVLEGKAKSISNLLVEQNSIKIQKILYLGLFSSKIVQKVTSIDNNEEIISAKLLQNKATSVSLFKVPELYIEKVRRLRSNSFKLFLESIYESSIHFPKWKIVADRYFTSVSTRLDLVKDKYIAFWTKEGLAVKDFDNDADLLKEYNLFVELRSDNWTDVYTNIWWKNEAEKQKDLDNPLQADIFSSESSSVISFLKTECK